MPGLVHLHIFPHLSQSPEQLHQQCWGHRTDSSSLLQQGTHQPQVSDQNWPKAAAAVTKKLVSSLGLCLFFLQVLWDAESRLLPPSAVSLFFPQLDFFPWDSIQPCPTVK